MSAPPLLATLLDVLQAFRIVLTKPSFRNMLVVVLGWLLTQGPHAVTEALVMAGVVGRRHHEAFHRFFSRARWEPDEMGRWIFDRLLPFVGEGAVQSVIDDTLAPKKGPHVFGIASHVDAVRSTRRHRVFCFGHCWVVLAVLVSVPFSKRTWALPVLFRLYRSKKETAEDEAAEYAKKTELARELLHVAQDKDRPWQKAEAVLYGKRTTVQFKTFCAQWYRACGAGLLRVVVVLTEHGQVPIRVFFCTDPAVDAIRILEKYSGRWGVECFFREAKQLLGFADSAARLERAVRRVAPLVGLLYTVLVVWFLEHHGRTFIASPPRRDWYKHKCGLSFADILREARGAIATTNILDLVNDSHNFKKASPPPPAPPSSQRLAA